MTTENKELERIFFPYAWAAKKALNAPDGIAKFIHYTTAENAASILKSCKIWMRNVTCMNDYSEVMYGQNIIEKILEDTEMQMNLSSVLNSAHPGAWEEAIRLYRQKQTNARLDTYVTSISEFDEPEAIGRLSMWNTFGKGSTGAAIVLNVDIDNEANQSGLIFSPVGYLTEREAFIEFQNVIKSVSENIEVIRALPFQAVAGAMFAVLFMTAVSLKHPGFKEEREWRVIHNPFVTPSVIIPIEVETVNGVPQVIAKIPLRNFPEHNITHLAPLQLVHSILIGPSQFQMAMAKAFGQLLINAGVPDGFHRIKWSDIPLREGV